MNLIYTVLFAFTLGYFIKNRGIAICVYLGLEALIFTFQTLNLLMEWAGGSQQAFGGPFPDSSAGSVASYGAVNLIITGIGVGLVVLGHKTAARRAKSTTLVEVG